MGDGRASEERPEETHKTHNEGFFPFRAEYRRVKFGSRKKGEDNRAGSREEGDPSGARTHPTLHEKCTNDKLGYSSNHDFR